MRSSMPPWPGSTVPLSLMPRWRLAMLSNRSPSTDASTVSSATTISAGSDASSQPV